MGLIEQIADRRSEIRTDGYPMSIGELTNLYRDGELDIHPEFQRFFRWSEEQKSRLIESLLLGIPIPSIFVSQREDGVWDVIDGLQRLSTIFQLIGLLRDEQDNEIPPLILKGTKYLPSLAGKQWENDDPSVALGNEAQLLIRRSKLDVKIVLRESGETSKYELFQRLNTGGSQLSDQEIRNVMLIMINADAYRWLTELAKDSNFQTCTAVSDRLASEQYDLELALRFLVFRKLDEKKLGGIGDIGEFLTDTMVEIGQPDTFSSFKIREEKAFKFTFEKLAQALEFNSFHRFDPVRGRYLGMFLISAFEAISMGFGYHFEQFENGAKIPDIPSIAESLWSQAEFINNSGSGVRASSRIPAIIPLGRRLFAPLT